MTKKTELLRVLELPELVAMVLALSRKVSFQTRCESGTKLKDTLMTINEMTKKLGRVIFYKYVLDRELRHFKLPSLADLKINIQYSAMAFRLNIWAKFLSRLPAK